MLISLHAHATLHLLSISLQTSPLHSLSFHSQGTCSPLSPQAPAQAAAEPSSGAACKGGGGGVVLVLNAIVVGDEGLFVTLRCV